ncbi:MAG TPA: hypothetical protein VHF25_13255 [Nitriliruptorales bacterium]|nr:hypothetical protein [Nitriliruptorales bacterium]
METRQLLAGVVGGIAGGIAFGAMMHMQQMMGMIAGLAGAEGAGVGWVVHLVISAVIGLGFAVTLGRAVTGWAAGAGAGLAYGAVWWVLGPLVIMPAWMGMPLLQIGETALKSLVGHLVYGIVLGLVFAAATLEVRSTGTTRGRTATSR